MSHSKLMFHCGVMVSSYCCFYIPRDKGSFICLACSSWLTDHWLTIDPSFLHACKFPSLRLQSSTNLKFYSALKIQCRNDLVEIRETLTFSARKTIHRRRTAPYSPHLDPTPSRISKRLSSICIICQLLTRCRFSQSKAISLQINLDFRCLCMKHSTEVEHQ